MPSSKQTRDHIDLWLDTSMKQGHSKKIIDSANEHDVEFSAGQALKLAAQAERNDLVCV
jgi:hypothetical protein